MLTPHPIHPLAVIAAVTNGIAARSRMLPTPGCDCLQGCC